MQKNDPIYVLDRDKSIAFLREHPEQFGREPMIAVHDMAAIRKDGRLAEFVKERYASWDSGIGAKIESGKVGFKELEAYMLKQGDATPNVSGRQEFLENLINEFI